MATYVDGFIVPVPTAKLTEYKKVARLAGKIFKEHGALSVTECWGDDVQPGKTTSFPQSVKLEPDETVVLSWITYTSRKHRDAVMAKAMQDPRMPKDPKAIPFDGKRMIFGGFKTIVDM